MLALTCYPLICCLLMGAIDVVDALNLITKKMGATSWSNFNADACEDEYDIVPVERTDPERNISCNCENNNTCHIVSL